LARPAAPHNGMLSEMCPPLSGMGRVRGGRARRQARLSGRGWGWGAMRHVGWWWWWRWRWLGGGGLCCCSWSWWCVGGKVLGGNPGVSLSVPPSSSVRSEETEMQMTPGCGFEVFGGWRLVGSSRPWLHTAPQCTSCPPPLVVQCCRLLAVRSISKHSWQRKMSKSSDRGSRASTPRLQ